MYNRYNPESLSTDGALICLFRRLLSFGLYKRAAKPKAPAAAAINADGCWATAPLLGLADAELEVPELELDGPADDDLEGVESPVEFVEPAGEAAPLGAMTLTNPA